MNKSTTIVPDSSVKPAKSTALWIVLLVAWLGWMFDGMEMGLYSYQARPALIDLLTTNNPAMARLAAENAQAFSGIIAKNLGYTLALFLLGCSLGGFMFGRLGDKIGRVKTMIITVLIYAAFTGLSALTTNMWQFGACRFLGAMGLGGEWGLGVALVMETWPNAKRPVLAGLLGSSANVGLIVSALASLWAARYAQTHHVEHIWRYLFCIGVAPALLSLIIRTMVKEPEKWVKAQKSGQRPDLSQLMVPGIRRNTILACFLSAVPIIGTWGVFQWNPTWVGGLVNGDQVKVALASICMSVGATIGSFAAGPIAEWIGRKTSYIIFCLTSLASCLVLYRVVDSYGPLMLVMLAITGICTTTFFGWLPLYLPELFPTRIRATGEGITFNFGRILAAAMICVGTGQLVVAFGGNFANATAVMSLVYVVGFVLIWFAPETKGQKLPD